MPKPTRNLQAWFDSSPSDSLFQLPGAFHSSVFMLGDESRIDAVVAALHKLEPGMPQLVQRLDRINGKQGLAKWSADKSKSKYKHQYRAMIRRSLLPAMLDAKAPAFIWSIVDAHVDIHWTKLCHSLGLKRSKFTVHQKLGEKQRFSHASLGSYVWNANQYKFLMCITDFIVSSLRSERKDKPFDITCDVVTDYISGDCSTDFRRAILLKNMIAHADKGKTDIKYRSTIELTRGLILADNLSGMSYQMLEEPTDPIVAHLWDAHKDNTNGVLIWNHTDENFKANVMTKEYAESLKQSHRQEESLPVTQEVTDALYPGKG